MLNFSLNVFNANQMNVQSSKSFFVTGIGTDVGKTVVSAIISEALNASYWKPVQSGELNNSDSLKIKRWTENVTVLEEQYRLTNPLSPHTSARIDGVAVSSEVQLPDVENTLIVEGAGGILVPVNDEGTTISDWVRQLKIPVIVVVKHYLGSINHTLLTLDYLKQRQIPVAGIVVTGERHDESEKIIETVTGRAIDLYIPYAEKVDKGFVTQQAILNQEKIKQWLLG